MNEQEQNDLSEHDARIDKQIAMTFTVPAIFASVVTFSYLGPSAVRLTFTEEAPRQKPAVRAAIVMTLRDLGETRKTMDRLFERLEAEGHLSLPSGDPT